MNEAGAAVVVPRENSQTPAPENERERLEALRRYDILDSAPEAAFDDIVRLAAFVCETPIACVSLVDADRLWFKAKVGITAGQTRRAGSFCDQTLRQTDIFVVEDARADERFATYPLVAGTPAIRFYAGAPLITPEGQTIGTLCVLDTAPRPLRPEQAEALRILSRQVMGQLELRRHMNEMQRVLSERERAVKALRRAEQQYRSIFEYAVEGIFQTTPQGRYRSANPMLARIFGYDSPEQMMAEVTDIGSQVYVDPERRAAFMRLLAQDDAVTGFESQVRRRDGRTIWIRENARALRDVSGKLLGYEGTVEDITERKRAEWALQRATEELEMRVRERTAKLAETNQALEAEIGERVRAEQELEQAHQEVLEAATERKRFYREVVRRVTKDKFHLVDAQDIPPEGERALDMALETMADYPPLREKLREIAGQAGMRPNDIRDFVLAVGEAATNAVKHAVDARCAVYVTPEKLIARVSDRGEGIQLENIPATLFQAGFSTKISLGMGYTLMLELTDRVWLATEPQGTVVQLEKWLHPEEHVEIPQLSVSAWEQL